MKKTKETIRRKVEYLLLAESESHGEGWVQPYQVEARVHTESGSDAWHIPTSEEDMGLQRVFNRLVGQYIDGLGTRSKSGKLPAKMERAMNRFNKQPSIESLLPIAEMVLGSGRKPKMSPAKQ